MKQPGGKEILVQGRPKNTAVNWINDQIKSLIRVRLRAVSQYMFQLCLEQAECAFGHANSCRQNTWWCVAYHDLLPRPNSLHLIITDDESYISASKP